MQNQKIKIAYVITRLICGGAQKVVLSLTTRLDREKYQVTVICGELPDSEKSCKSILADRGIELITIRQLIRNVSPINDAITLLKLFCLMREKEFDLIHTLTSKAGAVGRLAAFFARTPIIIYSPLGNIYGSKSNIPGVSDRPLMRAIFLFIERILAKFTDRIITLSEDEKNKYIELKIDKADKFITIYAGIDLEEFLDSQANIRKQDLGFNNSDLIVGSIGRLDPEKGHAYLIEAVPIVLAEIPQVKFLIIGDGVSRKELQERAISLGIKDSIRFLGLRKDVSRLLSIMDVFVLPSLYEAFGIAILEAMAKGLPVIASKVGGISELVIDGETGILIPAGNPTAIAESIKFLLKNKEKVKILGANGYARTQRYFTINLMVEKIEKLYNDLLKAKFLTKEG